jgi:hypothetical protein
MTHRRWIIYGVAFAVGLVLGWLARSPVPSPSAKPIMDAKTQVAKIDTVLAIDTHYANKWFPRYDTIRDTVPVPYWDTVWVKEYVKVADSTIFACRKALGSCLAAVKARDTVIVTQDRYIETVTKSSSKLRDIVGFGLGAVVGITVGCRR